MVCTKACPLPHLPCGPTKRWAAADLGFMQPALAGTVIIKEATARQPRATSCREEMNGL